MYIAYVENLVANGELSSEYASELFTVRRFRHEQKYNQRKIYAKDASPVTKKNCL